MGVYAYVHLSGLSSGRSVHRPAVRGRIAKARSLAATPTLVARPERAAADNYPRAGGVELADGASLEGGAVASSAWQPHTIDVAAPPSIVTHAW